MLPSSTPLNRRRFLQGTALTGAALVVSRAVQAAEDSYYGGFNMGIQSYSLRAFKVEEALAHTKTLGLKYWESFPAHLPITSVPAQLQAHKDLLNAAGITLNAYGVVGFDANEANARNIFDFAKAMGLKSISAGPKKTKETFDLLDKLVAEYDIPIAIHNHGPGDSFDKVTDVIEWTKDRHPKIGACVDTGHYLRSDENPVEVIEKLGARVFGVHFKDVKSLEGKKIFKILGEGDLDVLGCLKALRKLKYTGSLSLEYEESEKNPMGDLEQCLKAVRTAVAKL